MSIVLSGGCSRFAPAHYHPHRRLFAHLRQARPWRSIQQAYRGLETATAITDSDVPYRKQLKDEAKQRRAAGGLNNAGARKAKDQRAGNWELTVGIEVHAQLNTERKLFSRARTSFDAEPNTRVSVFDLAYPGAQPNFQKATLIPALRAAIALNCKIQRRSRFDRKHYFYPDQPAGYQITQYYEPLAKDGSIILYDHDGIAPEDGQSITIGIKQIQMEQDTAKTIQQDSMTLLDFNRVSHPLIEIITHPQIHSPQTAAACVKKIQAMLKAVNAVTTGMEMGGLRADVNVSVRSRGGLSESAADHEYSGVTGLGQRTEIKNLSSFKAVEEAIVAERDRQIEVLESGGAIEGETRGWTLGSIETTRLRGKEGEVDYRYMPDPDLAPIIISEELVDHITKTLPELPDSSIKQLVDDFGLTLKDAKTLVALDDGQQLGYFDRVLALLIKLLRKRDYTGNARECLNDTSITQTDKAKYARLVANWVIHELRGLVSSPDIRLRSQSGEVMARILKALVESRIAAQSAKKLLLIKLGGDDRRVNVIIKEEHLELVELSRAEYRQMALKLIDSNKGMAEKVRKGQSGKLMWFVGQMMKEGKGGVEADKAKTILEELLANSPS